METGDKEKGKGNKNCMHRTGFTTIIQHKHGKKIVEEIGDAKRRRKIIRRSEWKIRTTADDDDREYQEPQNEM